MGHILKKRRIAVPAILLPLALAGCWTPKIVSSDIGMRCEAQGFMAGTDPYIGCVTELRENGGNPRAVPAGAPAAPAIARVVCDTSGAAETPASRYAVDAGLVYDRKTNLTWQRCSGGQNWQKGEGCVGIPLQLTWTEALTGARPGWRLPTQNELLTLVLPACKSPSVNEDVFPGMKRGMLWYWSRTPNGPTAVWGVDFNDGELSSADNAADRGAVRLVRAGK